MNESILWEILKSFLLPIVTALGTWFWSRLKSVEKQRQLERETQEKMEREQAETTIALKDSMKCLLRRTIREDCNEYTNRGWISTGEFEELEEAFALYTKFGGNHTIPQLVHQVEKLPIRKPD